jgi:hypothetical protein
MQSNPYIVVILYISLFENIFQGYVGNRVRLVT